MDSFWLMVGLLACAASIIVFTPQIARLFRPDKVHGDLAEEFAPPVVGDGARKVETGVVSHATVGGAEVQILEECRTLLGIPRIRQRRVIRVRGEVATQAEARALADAILNYSGEI